MPITVLKVASSLMVAATVPVGLAGSMHAIDGLGLRMATLPSAHTITVQPGSIMYPPPGEFPRDGYPDEIAPIRLTIAEPIEIMAYQVSSAEYALCVEASRCQPTTERSAGSNEKPVTGVSYLDADAYARWYSETTGKRWRLPSDAEWAFVAAERFVGEYEGIEDDPKNPARRWLSEYSAEATRNRKRDPRPRILGSFGVNSRGLSDLSGNVWEWTSTCYVRATVMASGGGLDSSIENCGVHVLEGLHRAYMSNFISDGKSGGCAVGTPPDNLGFRLVRDRPNLTNPSSDISVSPEAGEPPHNATGAVRARPWPYLHRVLGLVSAVP